ncbi:efflux RND transporter periplasmic adaptor subunit [Peribacillus asahii]|uniref:efflux RND transporter periplasmic adaptor subunit n=1 Tax=Peribacillus asahii TaxID=228899 RepID=UPI0038268C0B
MKRWKVLSAVVVSGALLATNLYLITKEDSKVSRSIFVEDWTKVKAATVTETFETKGVTIPAEEYEVYFDESGKEFQRFLVKEGEEVTAGTPLFEYEVKDLEKNKGEVEREITEITGSITEIEAYIKKLTDYKAQVPTASTVSEIVQDGVSLDRDASSDLIISTLEQEIYKQELEKSKLEERKTRLDSQLTAMNELSGPLTIDAEVDGVVKQINQSLNNPVVTIASTQQAVKGVLSESQLHKTTVGMPVKITSPRLEKGINGTVGRVENYPVSEPSLNQKSMFPFQVVIEADEEGVSLSLALGSKVDVTVVTNEAVDVPTIPEKTVYGKNNLYVFKLTNNGYVNKQYVTAGLRANQKFEIASGPAEGEMVLVTPRVIPKNHSTFITPIQAEKVNLDAYETFTTREKWRYFLVGLLEK